MENLCSTGGSKNTNLHKLTSPEIGFQNLPSLRANHKIKMAHVLQGHFRVPGATTPTRFTDLSGSKGKRWGKIGLRKKRMAAVAEHSHKNTLRPMLHLGGSCCISPYLGRPIGSTDLYGLQLLVSRKSLSLYFPRDVNLSKFKSNYVQIFPEDLEKIKSTSWQKNSMCRTNVHCWCGPAGSCHAQVNQNP